MLNTKNYPLKGFKAAKSTNIKELLPGSIGSSTSHLWEEPPKESLDTKIYGMAEQSSPTKSPYNTFVSYVKTKYDGIEESAKKSIKKIVEGPVKITLEKLIKTWQYLLAALNPQWNMPTLSRFDYDTLAPPITNHIVISEENIKYTSGYEALRYRVNKDTK